MMKIVIAVIVSLGIGFFAGRMTTDETSKGTKQLAHFQASDVIIEQNIFDKCVDFTIDKIDFSNDLAEITLKKTLKKPITDCNRHGIAEGFILDSAGNQLTKIHYVSFPEEVGTTNRESVIFEVLKNMKLPIIIKLKSSI